VCLIPICKLLPDHAREILQHAAATPIPDGQPLARKKALDAANRRVRKLYPKFFITEKE